MATKQQINPTIQQEIAAHHVSNSVGAIINILQQAETGDIISQCELFDDMMHRDAHIAGEMRKRKLAVAQLEWSLTPSRDAMAREKKDVANFEIMLKDSISFDTLIYEMCDAIGKGFSAHDIEWGRNDKGLWIPKKLNFRPQRWFTLDYETRQEIRLRNNKDAYGEPLIDNGWIIHNHSSQTMGFVAQQGLLRELALPYIFKNFAIKNWLRFTELYAVPIIVLFHHEKDEIKKIALKNAIQSIGKSGVALFEGGTQDDLKTVDAARGEGQGFQALIDWCEGSISKSVLGGTLTSQTGKNGNYATANIHNDVRLQIRDYDARQIAETLTEQLLGAINRVNGLNIRAKFTFDTSEPEDLALFADAIPKLVAVGMKISPEYLHEKLKIPLAKDGEQILGTKLNELSGLYTKAGLSMDLMPIKFTPEQQVIEDLADKLLENTPIGFTNEQLQNVIKAAKSPDDLEQRLAVLMQDCDFAQFSKTLERSLFAADLIGYANA